MDQTNLIYMAEKRFEKIKSKYLEAKIFNLRKKLGPVYLKNRGKSLENDDYLFFDESDGDLSDVVVRIPKPVKVPDYLCVSSYVHSFFGVSRKHSLVRLFIDSDDDIKLMSIANSDIPTN